MSRNLTKRFFICVSLNVYLAFMFHVVGYGQEVAYPERSIVFSHPQGFYPERFQLDLTVSDPAASIHYTLDGSEPTPESPAYQRPIMVTHRALAKEMLSTIPTNPDDSPDCWIWQPPGHLIKHGTVVRAVGFVNGHPVTPVITQVYFVGLNPDDYGVPVISIVTDPAHLFDHETGIYVPGLTNEMDPHWPTAWGTGNYHQRGEAWERPAVLAVFSHLGSTALQQNIGIRIHGGGSRALPIKSLRLYARDSYDEDYLHYPFFADEPVASFRRLILRNSGQDFKYSYLNDAISHVLIRHLDIETQSFQPAILFINGEYWGIHHIRDRIDKYYLEYRKGADPDALDLLTGIDDVVEGSNESYLDMLDFIRNNDMQNPQVFEEVERQMDMANFVGYNIAKQYIAVYDWPGNNVDYWRPHTENGRWRWIYYDNDGAFIDHQHDFYAHSTLEGSEEWPNPDWSTFLFRNLMENQVFKERYLERFAYHLENTFSADRVISVTDSLTSIIRPLMPAHIQRWKYPESMSFWESKIEKMKRFAMRRPCIARSILIEHLQLDDETFLPDLCAPTNKAEGFSTGMQHHRDETSLNVYPNPSSGHELWVEYRGPAMKRTYLEMYDMTGRRVLSIPRAFRDFSHSISLTVNHLPRGIYMLVMRGPETVTTQPVILQ